jgi:hypothetical protein
LVLYGQTDMTELIVAFRKFANALKKLPTPRERERGERESRSHYSTAGSMATSSAMRHSEGTGVVVE